MERKEAIEVVKKNWPDSSFTRLREALETLVPELKESEDERIRKALMQNLKERFGTKGNMGEGLYMPDVLAWFEKQGGQESITFNNARVIDSTLNNYCCKQYTALHKENGGVLSFARLQHLAMDIYGWCKKQGEQKPVWSEEDKTMLCYMKGHLEYLKNDKGYSSSEDQAMLKRQLDWLKSMQRRVNGG